MAKSFGGCVNCGEYWIRQVPGDWRRWWEGQNEEAVGGVNSGSQVAVLRGMWSERESDSVRSVWGQQWESGVSSMWSAE